MYIIIAMRPIVPGVVPEWSAKNLIGDRLNVQGDPRYERFGIMDKKCGFFSGFFL